MLVARKEIVVVSPYGRIVHQLKGSIKKYEPAAAVNFIGELNGVISVGCSAATLHFGKNYAALRGVDFVGNNWKLDKEPDFAKYVERQLREAGDAMAAEMLIGHAPSLVIDFEQLLGVRGDVYGVYNITGFDSWCSKNAVPRLSLPEETKASLSKRMESNPFDGDRTHIVYFDGTESRMADEDMRIVLSGQNQGISFFRLTENSK